MGIKPKHKHVDSTGKCYFPYLSQWNPNTCNLLGLLFQMSQAFSQDPPVYSKPTQPIPQPNSNPQYPPNQFNTIRQPPNPQYPPSYQQPPVDPKKELVANVTFFFLLNKFFFFFNFFF